jgi:hypothetical protein
MGDGGLAIFAQGEAGGMMVLVIVYLAVIVLMIAGMWATFAKAGKPGWAAIVPIYNIIVMLEIAQKPIWWFVLFLIPIVNLIIMIMVYVDLAKYFGKGGGFAVGLLLLGPIFWPILGFGSAQYEGGGARRPRYDDAFDEGFERGARGRR